MTRPNGSARQILSGLGHAALVTSILMTLVVGGLTVVQRRLIYPLGYDGAPRPQSVQGFRSTTVDTPSGRLLVWTSTGRPDRPVLLFMHGNATTLRGAAHVTRAFIRAGWTIVVPEYPGYPGNAGSPSQAGLLDAARAGWISVETSGRRPDEVVVMGNSIGSGPAIALAAEKRPRGLAIVSGIASLPDVVRSRLPFIPDFLVWDRFYNERALRQVDVPVMVVHGMRDDVSPHEQGARLAAASHTTLVTVPGGHDIIADIAVQNGILRNFE